MKLYSLALFVNNRIIIHCIIYIYLKVRNFQRKDFSANLLSRHLNSQFYSKNGKLSSTRMKNKLSSTKNLRVFLQEIQTIRKIKFPEICLKAFHRKNKFCKNFCPQNFLPWWSFLHHEKLSITSKRIGALLYNNKCQNAFWYHPYIKKAINVWRHIYICMCKIVLTGMTDRFIML